ncbi:uracil-DNA glycosylase [Malaciobacter molluscorum LMG 25693]|uniref:Uracil-DNA glycosylase n=1 Tax=Malaciobacter molluscorum LMG 25693 TaxID=870501 RepID=A0A2G1DHK8_9BACT|nr:uracil-DNA glycosylase [Malaciobacter molluscorum]AXX93666.1 uracil-DNA glycosylase, family 1 [Malaciobacter molluscorum LMG 25693]PHO17924.1 uracil-DNA glycosylase [Malaciobacter molluscorum LMG 25693]RXJ93657.1 uracil-DNA glycosylase [Malaciobacter molluscorum]
MNNWKQIIEDEKKKDYFKKLMLDIKQKYKTSIIYPKYENIFRAFELTSLEDLKVVILGQDPYHGEGQAQGLAFSTPKQIKNPPSMVNILKEINQDLQKKSSCEDGDLTSWAKQGVLLLNTILTVEKSKPKSHHKLGWEIFTDNIIKNINDNCDNIIFLLWGTPAISKSKLIDEKRHHILTSVHPSPLSAYRGFFGCKHFSQTNEILKSINKNTIDW